MADEREEKKRIYAAIDLKSFYASVECVERSLDPLRTNLVVADLSRTEKTICLAVSPSLKNYGIGGRSRLFEVVEKTKEINRERSRKIGWKPFQGSSYFADELEENPYLRLDYVVARPQMALYMEYSTRIYQIYLRYIAPEDIHVYSIDEVFIDLTSYIHMYQLTAHELVRKLISEVLEETGITATAGIGTNLYLAKVAMDIVAKHIPADQDGVRIAELDERSYREKLWNHQPLTDFWRVGRGYTKKLTENGLYTMGDIARCSIGSSRDYYNEELLYQLFGINAELLIDHAWGWEPTRMVDIKEYKPKENSISNGQVLTCPYDAKKARLVLIEMADLLVLELVKKGFVTDQLVLTVGYDISNLSNNGKDTTKKDNRGKCDIGKGNIREEKAYQGEVKKDRYGRKVPKQAHGSIHLKRKSSSTKLILEAAEELYDRIIDPKLLVRRIYLVANHVQSEQSFSEELTNYEQLNLFTDYKAKEKERKEEQAFLEKEKKIQKAVLSIKDKYGKNAILKGMNFEEGATTRERNQQIGGHRA
jgi:DNA polymerase V